MSQSPLIIDPPGKADACVIWLHGLGADRYDFVPVVEALRLPPGHGIRFIFPQAPTRPVTINNGLPMPCWFDILGLSPERIISTQQMAESVRTVLELVEQQREQGIAIDRIILAGFSQGGAVALHAALESRLPFGGLMALSTYGPTLDVLLQDASAGPRLDVFFAHGRYDDILPMPLGRDAHDRLAARGHTTHWHYYDMSHEVCPEEIVHIRSWLTQRLGL